MTWANIKTVERVEALYQPPAIAAWIGKPGAWVVVKAGWVALVQSPAIAIDGVLRLDGVVRVECV